MGFAQLGLKISHASIIACEKTTSAIKMQTPGNEIHPDNLVMKGRTRRGCWLEFCLKPLFGGRNHTPRSPERAIFMKKRYPY